MSSKLIVMPTTPHTTTETSAQTILMTALPVSALTPVTLKSTATSTLRPSCFTQPSSPSEKETTAIPGDQSSAESLALFVEECNRSSEYATFVSLVGAPDELASSQHSGPKQFGQYLYNADGCFFCALASDKAGILNSLACCTGSCAVVSYQLEMLTDRTCLQKHNFTLERIKEAF